MTYNDAVVLGTDAKELMNGGENAMLLPQALTAWDWDGGNGDKENTNNGAYLAVLVKITTKDGALVYPFNEDSEDYAWAAIPVEGSWGSRQEICSHPRFHIRRRLCRSHIPR